MKAAPVERGVASAAYSFVRFGGGAVAPWLAGKLGEDAQRRTCRSGSAPAPSPSPRSCSLSGRRVLAHIDAEPGHGAPSPPRRAARPRPSPSATPDPARRSTTA